MSENKLTAANEQPETPATESPAVATTAAPTLVAVQPPAAAPTIDPAAVDAIKAEVMTPTARKTSLHISNVIRDGDSIDLVLYKSTLSDKKMTVYYADTGKRENAPYIDGVELLDTLPDGGQVINITRGTETRTYTTVHLSLDELHLDLTGAVWEPRHKIRKPKQPVEA